MSRILIGTPAYSGMVHVDYLHSILALRSAGLAFDLATIGNESLIPRARNKLAGLLLQSKHDFLLFWDADVACAPEGIRKLLSANKPIVAAPVRLKDPSRVVWNYGKVLSKEGPLLEVDRVGTGLMLIHRKVIETLAIKVPNYKHEASYSLGTKLSAFDIPDLFQCGCRNGEYLSEDYSFCLLAREHGFSVWVDTSVQTTHAGTITIGGS